MKWEILRRWTIFRSLIILVNMMFYTIKKEFSSSAAVINKAKWGHKNTPKNVTNV